jgi:hypothetical protein
MGHDFAFALALVGVVSLLPGAQGCTSDESVTTCTDANVQLIQSSSYDQSCKVDSDCVGVAEGNACYPCTVQCQAGGAINRNALAGYESDLSKTIGAREEATAPPCGCAAMFYPCCRGGTCHADLECQNMGPEGDAAADTGADADGPAACIAAGGECLVGGAISVCALAGPQDCNPERGPSGSYCCLRKAGVADAAAESGSADASGE